MRASELLFLLTLHFLADFVFQSDRVAQRKSKSWLILIEHVSLYSFVMVVGLMVAMMVTAWRFDANIVRFWLLTFALHFAQDAVTSRVNARLWPWVFTAAGEVSPIYRGHPPKVTMEPLWFIRNKGTNHWFFVGIGFDQLLHTYALAWAWMLVM